MHDKCLHVQSTTSQFKPPAQLHIKISRKTTQTQKRRRRETAGRMRSSNLLCFFVLLVLVLCHGVSMARKRSEEEEEDWGKSEKEWDKGGGRGGEGWFLLKRSLQVVKTDAGEMRVVMSLRGEIVNRPPMHIGFITMEPRTLFIPQYIDSDLMLFVRRGEARVGFIYQDDLAERGLKTGDIYCIPAGSTFYIENIAEGQRLHIICSIVSSESLGLAPFQTFFIGGGTNPSTVLGGFQPETLANAFNVSEEEVTHILYRQREGPIVYATESHSPKLWEKFLQLKEQDRLQQLKRMVEFEKEPQEEEKEFSWTWRKLLNSVFGIENKKDKDDRRTSKGPDSYNIYKRKPDFRNHYGWSMALDESDYDPLKQCGVGVYLVNLTAGSMVAPHVNPTATEYGIVLSGKGKIKIVYPNGSLAMDAIVGEGDVFRVPRYFAFCQIASRTGPFEFFGFTTSARKNRPQFLAGSSSILRTLPCPELAASFGVSVDRCKNFKEAQHEAVILPSPATAPPDKKVDVKVERVPDVIKSFAHDMVMGFD